MLLCSIGHARFSDMTPPLTDVPRGTPATDRQNVSAATTDRLQDRLRYIRRDEVQAALREETRDRLRALLQLLWYSGCRISEALAVRVGDVDVGSSSVVMVNLKQKRRVGGGGRASKVCPLPPRFAGELAAMGPAPGRADGQLFAWTRTYAYRLVRAALERGGVERDRAHPHALRHGHAVHALRGGATLDVVKNALGHSSIQTTALYLRATSEDVRKAYAGIQW